jgi:hypothetical protein
MVEDYRSSIEQGVVVARPVLCGLDNAYQGGLERLPRGQLGPAGRHRGAAEKIRELAEGMLAVPEGFEMHPRVEKIWGSGARWPRATRWPTGASPRTWPTPPWWTRDTRCASPARTPGAGPSSTATR